MKITFLTLFIVLFFNASGQEWAPIGASWHYTFNTIWSPPPNSFSKKYEVTGDTTINGQTCSKIVKEHVVNNRPNIEYMYQENDSVFFYDTAFAEFQVLYDFNAEIDDFWYIKVKDINSPGDIDTVKVIVTDFDYIDVNGTMLKRMQVIYEYLYENPTSSYSNGTIVQTLGDLNLLFNYDPHDGVIYDGPYSSGLRCYDDFNIGHYEATGINGYCEFVATLSENSFPTLSFFPNPVEDLLTISLTEKEIEKVLIYDLNGKLMLSTSSDTNIIDLTSIPEGNYMIKVICSGEVLVSHLIKE